jgi:hypothetical protein
VLGGNIRLYGGKTGIFVFSGGTLRMEAGATITNMNDCGVDVSSGTFIMNGGMISSNTSSGVSIGGTFTMNGGTISNNNYSGVFLKVNGAIFTMNDGEISGNRDHGGVYVLGGNFTMNNGTISGNTATNLGGGVYINSSIGVFVKTGGTITADNRAGGNNSGHVAFGGVSRVRNSAAGPSVRMDSRVAGSAGGWE